MNSNTRPLRILEARFDLPLKFSQITRWRGAFAEWAMANIEDESISQLFHNHDGDTEYHYRYPKIQYRCHRRKAAIMAVDEGVEALYGLLQKGNWSIRWEGKPLEISTEALQMNTPEMRLDTKLHTYRCRNWMALNPENHRKWDQLKTFVEKVEFLDKILPNHLIGLARNFGWRIPGRFDANITMIDSIHSVESYESNLLAFNVLFTTNLVLPAGIGIGKSCARGYGIVTPQRIYQTQNHQQNPADIQPLKIIS